MFEYAKDFFTLNIYENNSLHYKVNFEADSLFEDYYCTSCHYCAYTSRKIIFLPIIVHLVPSSISYTLYQVQYKAEQNM